MAKKAFMANAASFAGLRDFLHCFGKAVAIATEMVAIGMVKDVEPLMRIDIDLERYRYPEHAMAAEAL